MGRDRQAHSAGRSERRGRGIGRHHTRVGICRAGTRDHIGLAAGVICFSAVRMKPRFGYDDALDVVGVHAIGGIFGALATGLFASAMVNPAGANGLFYGNPRQLGIQAVGVLATIGFSLVGGSILLKVTDLVVGIRVDEEEEHMGLDLSQHNESAYAVEA